MSRRRSRRRPSTSRWTPHGRDTACTGWVPRGTATSGRFAPAGISGSSCIGPARASCCALWITTTRRTAGPNAAGWSGTRGRVRRSWWRFARWCARKRYLGTRRLSGLLLSNRRILGRRSRWTSSFSSPTGPRRNCSATASREIGFPRPGRRRKRRCSSWRCTCRLKPPRRCLRLRLVVRRRLERLWRLMPTPSSIPTPPAASGSWPTATSWSVPWQRRGNSGPSSCTLHRDLWWNGTMAARRGSPARPAPERRSWPCTGPCTWRNRIPTREYCSPRSRRPWPMLSGSDYAC